MNRDEILAKLTAVFRDVFDDENIIVNENTTAEDIEGWDSLTHVSLITEVESVFKYKFSMKDVLGMKNIGEMIDLLAKG